MPDKDRLTFGEELRAARKSRGLLQKEVVARLEGFYTEAANYGRAEQGKRVPEKDTVVAILVRGLGMREVREINRLLNLAGHEELRTEELVTLGLSMDAEPQAPPLPPLLRTASSWPWIGLLAVTTAAVVPVWIASSHALFVVVTSALYASLFVISIYLESAFDTGSTRRESAAVWVFTIVLLSAGPGLLLDETLVRANNPLALPLAGAIFLGSAAAQYFLAKRSLPPEILVPARFQTMTAQTAHLKNSCYFLLLVALFWLPAYHAVLTSTKNVLFGVRDLLLLLLAMIAVSLYMGSHLLDRLRPHDRLNRYTQLFYLRALVYFALCLVCIGWFAYSTSSLN